MKVTKITYSKKFPYAPYLNESIGFEAEIDETENVHDCVQKLREQAELSFKTAHPTVVLETPVEEVKTKEEIKADTLKAINECATKEELSAFKLLKNTDRETFNAYTLKEKTLLK